MVMFSLEVGPLTLTLNLLRNIKVLNTFIIFKIYFIKILSSFIEIQLTYSIAYV